MAHDYTINRFSLVSLLHDFASITSLDCTTMGDELSLIASRLKWFVWGWWKKSTKTEIIVGSATGKQLKPFLIFLKTFYFRIVFNSLQPKTAMSLWIYIEMNQSKSEFVRIPEKFFSTHSLLQQRRAWRTIDLRLNGDDSPAYIRFGRMKTFIWNESAQLLMWIYVKYYREGRRLFNWET